MMDGMWDLKSFPSSPHFCSGQIAQVPPFLCFTLFLGKEEILQIIIKTDSDSILPYRFFHLA